MNIIKLAHASNMYYGYCRDEGWKIQPRDQLGDITLVLPNALSVGAAYFLHAGSGLLCYVRCAYE